MANYLRRSPPDINSRHRKRPRLEEEQRDWSDIPFDVLSVIFAKLRAVEVLRRTQYVCRKWRQLALQPYIWHRIKLCFKHEPHADEMKMLIARQAIDRSLGHIEEFYTDYATDDLLSYIGYRTTKLRSMGLYSTNDVTAERLCEFVSRCPVLEELELTHCCISKRDYGLLGQARPELKCFRLNERFVCIGPDYSSMFFEDEHNKCYRKEALEIANNMQQLRKLQLVGNLCDNDGLEAILSKCVYLEYLDIRQCFNIDVKDSGLQTKLKKIKTVRLPDISQASSEFETGMGGEDGCSDHEYEDCDIDNDHCSMDLTD